jgi:hypothetical protein
MEKYCIISASGTREYELLSSEGEFVDFIRFSKGRDSGKKKNAPRKFITDMIVAMTAGRR